MSSARKEILYIPRWSGNWRVSRLELPPSVRGALRSSALRGRVATPGGAGSLWAGQPASAAGGLWAPPTPRLGSPPDVWPCAGAEPRPRLSAVFIPLIPASPERLAIHLFSGSRGPWGTAGCREGLPMRAGPACGQVGDGFLCPGPCRHGQGVDARVSVEGAVFERPGAPFLWKLAAGAQLCRWASASVPPSAPSSLCGPGSWVVGARHLASWDVASATEGLLVAAGAPLKPKSQLSSSEPLLVVLASGGYGAKLVLVASVFVPVQLGQAPTGDKNRRGSQFWPRPPVHSSALPGAVRLRP